jgi:hypothetical protein
LIEINLPFDLTYEKERKEKWKNEYEDMRIEMLEKYRPNSRSLKTFKKRKLNNYN